MTASAEASCAQSGFVSRVGRSRLRLKTASLTHSPALGIPGSSCIVNAYSSNHELLVSSPDMSTTRRLVLHGVDAVGLVHVTQRYCDTEIISDW